MPMRLHGQALGDGRVPGPLAPLFAMEQPGVGEDRFGMELDALGGQLAVADAHYLAISAGLFAPSGDFELLKSCVVLLLPKIEAKT